MKHSFLHLFFFYSMAILCIAGSDIIFGQTQPAPIRLEAGWTVYRGQAGLVLFHPTGWQIHEKVNGGFLAYRIAEQGNANALVLVQPIAKIDGHAAGINKGLERIFPDLFPGVRVHNVRSVSISPEVSVAGIFYEAVGSVFKGTTMCFRSGESGVLYVMASHPDTWALDAPVMEQILTRFFYSAGTPVQHADVQLIPDMVLYRDPREGAFTCPVPKGWGVEGGLQRFSALDIRPEVMVTSPDGKVLIRIGDAWIPNMASPGHMMSSTGFAEGSWYSPDGVSRQLVQRYLPGASFLTDFYLPRRVGPVSNVNTRQMLELSRMEMQMQSQAGIHTNVDTGEVHFDAGSGQDLKKGYAFAQTIFFPIYGSAGDGWWKVNRFHGYLADPDREHLALDILGRMVAGFRVDPQWFAAQLRTTANVSAAWQASQNEISDMLYNSYRERARSQDLMAERFARSIRGEVLIEDPYTRERFEVPAGSNYYWRVEGARDFIGTETPDPHQLPDYWVRQMRMID